MLFQFDKVTTPKTVRNEYRKLSKVNLLSVFVNAPPKNDIPNNVNM